MTLERLPRVAAAGVDFVSMGAITHARRAVDVSSSLRSPAGARDDPEAVAVRAGRAEAGPVRVDSAAARRRSRPPMTEEVQTGSEELVLAFLAEAGDEYLSARRSPTSSAHARAVWKHVESLRARGYRIDAVPARGTGSARDPRRARPARAAPLLGTHDLGQVLHCFEELGSTSDRPGAGEEGPGTARW